MSEYKFLNNPRTTKKKKPNKHEPKLLWPRCTKFMKNGGTYTYGVVDGIVGPTTKAFWGPPF